MEETVVVIRMALPELTHVFQNSHEHQTPDVVVVHETDGRKYFEALQWLNSEGLLGSLTYVEASVIRKFARGVFREKVTFTNAVVRAFRNLYFRMQIPLIKGRTIILGVAPWDFRFLVYQCLRKRNRYIYHTSWPHWDAEFTPRRYGPLTRMLRKKWLSTLAKLDVEVVAVTQAAADSLLKVVPGKKVAVIPHVISEQFFRRRATFSRAPFRILFVGELIAQKGIHLLAPILDNLKDVNIYLDIVGDGPLQSLAHELGHCLGLNHTHNAKFPCAAEGNEDCADCWQEPVSRTRRQPAWCLAYIGAKKCSVYGDGLCDTPGEPILSEHVVVTNPISNCFVDWNSNVDNTDNWGAQWVPMEFNIMSYAGACRDLFSPGQIAVMLANVPSFATTADSYSIAGPSTICAYNTYAYSVPSLSGVTNYTWTVPAGASVVSGQGTNSVSVYFGANVYYQPLAVTPNCGGSAFSAYNNSDK